MEINNFIHSQEELDLEWKCLVAHYSIYISIIGLRSNDFAWIHLVHPKERSNFRYNNNMEKCSHGLTFNLIDAMKLPLIEFRRRYPRLNGACPLNCGFVGVAYASVAHFKLGDW